MEKFYTHAMWKVRPGDEALFVEAWRGLADALLSIPVPATRGTLIQSLDDPSLFYSFGPWESLEDIHAMRSNPDAQASIRRVVELCEHATPAGYRVVAEIAPE
ncbi:MAG TPA: antibiotic biosynthesis monooxygenase family protein [Chloroflexia bacterium]|jgi:quinol monooxygenase YgiN